jgi:hypothetical protein
VGDERVQSDFDDLGVNMYEPVVNIILSSLSKEYQTAVDISQKVGLTTAKTTALLCILVREEKVEKTKIKVKRGLYLTGFRLKDAE